MKNRALKERLTRRAAGKLGRLLILTGARQTGKTTLAREAFPGFEYISFDDPTVRPSWTALSARDWVERHPRAVLDEVQKAPAVIEAVRAAHDLDGSVRYLLLGSSQILLLSKVRESMAGRAGLEELWPLTLPEALTSGWDDEVPVSRLVRWLRSRDDAGLEGVPASDRGFSAASEAFERYLQFGGMPVIHDPDVHDDERLTWLSDYQRTYLERDVADLAALRDLEPFVKAQRALAWRTASLVNLADLARDVSVSPVTIQRFMRYLELSYQVIQLAPWHRNSAKRLSKMPKVHFVDPGVQRSILGRRGVLTGQEFESAVVSEILRQVRTDGIPGQFYHLRTYDGREVDLLIELEDGFVGIEVKMTEHVSPSDAAPLRNVGSLLDRPVLLRLVVSKDRTVHRFPDGTLALPAAWLLGPAERCER